MKLKAQIDLLKMSIAGENVHDAHVLHDYHARQIDEGDVGLVVVTQSQVVGAAKLTGRDVLQAQPVGLHRLKQVVREVPSRAEGNGSK